jgi:hypothetical protein
VEYFLKLITFVFDFVHLPVPLENEFRKDSLLTTASNDQDMSYKPSTSSKLFAEELYERIFGFNPKKELNAAKREVALQREQLQREQLQREQLQREQLQREQLVRKLHNELNLPMTQIANVLSMSVEDISKILGKDI